MGSTEYWSADPLSHSGQRGTHDRQARQSIRQLVRTINEHYHGVVIADKKEEVDDHLGASGALGRQCAGLRQELWRRGMEDRVRSGRPRKLRKNEVRQADRELARNRKEG